MAARFEKLNDDETYLIEGWVLNRIFAIASRLNTDIPFGPFELRDLAQEIQAKLGNAEGPVDLEKLPDEHCPDCRCPMVDVQEVDEASAGCSLCGGVLQELGRLGDTLHYRCRDCGAGFSTGDQS